MPANHSSEETLIQRAQQGKADAVAELYHLHAGEIFRYCLFRVGDQATAEDLTEEVFLNMVEALPRYVNQGAPFAAWLYRIAHHRVVDYHRRMVHRQTEALPENLMDGASDPEDQAIHQAEIRRLKNALARLDDEQQTVLQLRFVEGYSLEETARLLGKTVGAIKARQHRALRQLAQTLGQ